MKFPDNSPFTGDAPFSFQPDKMSFIDREYSLFLQEDSLCNLYEYVQRRGTWMHSYEALSLSDHKQFCQCTFPFFHPNEGVIRLENRACVYAIILAVFCDFNCFDNRRYQNYCDLDVFLHRNVDL